MESDKSFIVLPKTARFEEITSNPKLINIICNHIASGGSLFDLTETYGIEYAELNCWLNEDAERSRRYLAACDDRFKQAENRLLDELALVATSDIRQIFNQDGSMRPVTEWPENVARSVKSIKIDELFEGSGKERQQVGHTKQVQFWDKVKSLELIGKKLGMFADRVDHTIKLEDLVNDEETN